VKKTALLLAAAAFALAGASRAEPEKPWRGWDQYQAILWSTGSVPEGKRAAWSARLDELGVTAEPCSEGEKPSRGFYVENLVPELAFLHAREKLYDEDWKGYTASQDRKHLVRRPCFDDPDTLSSLEGHVKQAAASYVSATPLLYDLRDELSIGRFANPMDYCFCPKTLDAFRNWLMVRYRFSLEALDQEWGTKHASWDEVRPETTYEAKEREKADLAAGRLENYAPWADHREFMDMVFARTLDRLRADIHETDPITPVGVEGTQMPSAWGGYDLWRLSQAVDWVEPYDIASSHSILRSFLPARAPTLATVFGDDAPRLRRSLYWLLLHGDRGCVIWDDEQSRCIEKEKDLSLTARGKALAPILHELRALAPKVFALEPEDDRVAIHYSQASIRAWWMIESREDGKTWPKRFSSYEAAHSRLARLRDGYLRVVEDLGLTPVFLSTEQIERGELAKGKWKALLLPGSIAMSKKECAEVEAFGQAGGVVIASADTATMDEHGKRLPRSQLALRGLGVIDLDLADYGKARLSGGGKKERELVKHFLPKAPVAVLSASGEPLAGTAVVRLRGSGVELIAVLRNPEREAAALKEVGYPDNAALEKAERATILLPKKTAVIDVRSGKALGTVDRVTVDLDPWTPTILEVRR
jgi:hypothetical protein